MNARLPEAKRVLRAELRRRRGGLSPAERAAEEAALCAALHPWLSARGEPPLAGYVAVNGELDLGDLYRERWSRGGAVWFPRVVAGDRLAWHPVRDPAALRPGFRGIPEPDPARCPAAALPVACVLLVPGLGYDAQGVRLGQGAGFYDRELAVVRAGRAVIGVGFACQRCDELPVEAHDRPVDAVLLGGRWLLGPPG